MRHAVAVGSLLTLASCATTGASDVSDVKMLLNDVAAADSSENLDAISALYAIDAEWLPPTGPPVVGLPAIREHYRILFAASDLDVQVLAHEIRAAGDFAYVVGSTHVTNRPRHGGVPATTEDRYVMILRRTPPDSRWRIRYLMWNPLTQENR